MNRTRKPLEMNKTSQSGSWAVSRSERNTELSMNLSVGARSIAPRVALSTSGRSNAPRSRFMVPMRVQSLEVEADHEPPLERGIHAASACLFQHGPNARPLVGG